MTPAIDAWRDALLAHHERNAGALPWIASPTTGRASKLLRVYGDRGFAELIRMEPGVAMPLHRHAGEVHAWNLAGERVLHTGERVVAGGYVHEPPGTVDWWKAVGDEPLVALVVVFGSVEFLGPGDTVCARVTAASRLADYERHCRETGRRAVDVGSALASKGED
ncbi:MAG TPA: anti-sigma factor [Dokdonella sp.]|nr:anti-sigma factor [Dokdonella sp.]